MHFLAKITWIFLELVGRKFATLKTTINHMWPIHMTQPYAAYCSILIMCSNSPQRDEVNVVFGRKKEMVKLSKLERRNKGETIWRRDVSGGFKPSRPINVPPPVLYIESSGC